MLWNSERRWITLAGEGVRKDVLEEETFDLF